jgi:phage tail-like protein
MSNSERERPYGNAHFLVDLGAGDPRAAASGFCEVIFPEFRIDAATARAAEQDREHRLFGTAGAAPPGRLILRRGVTGKLDLYGWWDKARRGKAPKRRSVTVHLLADDHETIVLSWRFSNARPVSLSYAPLRAQDGGVLLETIELEYERVEMR